MYDPTETDDTHEQNRISPPIIANPQRLLMSDADTESTADDGYDDGNRTAQSVTPITGNTPTQSVKKMSGNGIIFENKKKTDSKKCL